MRRVYIINIYLIVMLILLTYPLCFGSDSNIEMNKAQGIVMEIDLKNNIIIVNEKLIHIDSSTLTHDDRGTPVSIDRIKKKGWVYIEWSKEENRSLAKKIYLLPKFIEKRERHHYPFMK